MDGRKKSWSTRYKYKDLPMYVYKFPVKGHKGYRVCKKMGDKVKTLGYYRTLQAATLRAWLLKYKGE